MDGAYLSLPASFLRYCVIAFIFYNSWVALAIVSTIPALNNNIFNIIDSALLFLLILGMVLLVPLHPLKRGLHDLICRKRCGLQRDV